MRQHETFWTMKRLTELGKLFTKFDLDQLAKHFGKRREEITQAYEFWVQHKRLKISSKKIKRLRITHYLPGHAEGYNETRHFRSEDYVL